MGARGVLAATMLDAHAVVDAMLSDLRQREQCPQETQIQVQTTAVPPSPPTPKSDVSLNPNLNPKASLEGILPPVLTVCCRAA